MEKQDYLTIKRDCLEKRKLFEDPQFLTDNSFLPLCKATGKPKKVDKWMRPGEICHNPKFVVDDFSRSDIKQGSIGDCWFLAAVTNLTMNPELFNRVVCKSNSFDEDYAGIFHFHFWRNDEWESVVIDDRLPTYENKLVFAKSAVENEFWIALLEKAFAKFKGNYKVLEDYGTMCEAAEDLTGGITEKFCIKPSTSFHLKCPHTHVCYDEIEKSFLAGNFMGCFIRSKRDKTRETTTDQQLIRGHAFSITNVKRLYCGNQEIRLLRLRNPWGRKEWNGDWSDNCPNWNDISFNTKNELGLKNLNDGEFWMSYEDFYKNFDIIEICSLSTQTLLKLNEECVTKIEKKVFNFKCMEKNKIDEFCNDPEYVIKIQEKSTVIVTITQTSLRQLMVIHSNVNDFMFPLHLIVHKISEDTKSLCFGSKHDEISFVGNGITNYEADICCPRTTFRIRNITPGTYVVCPTTSNKNAKFYFRVFFLTENSFKFKKIQTYFKCFKNLCTRRLSQF